ncbi:MAG: cytochrome c3 family protein [Myxococcota bacterium]
MEQRASRSRPLRLGNEMQFRYPPWTNKLRYVAAAALAGGAVYATTILNYGFSPYATDVGYRPEQPVPFSHAIHAGQLGMDCRYCHQTVEKAAHAAIPSTETCMACHTRIHTESPKLEPVRKSWETGEPVSWVRIHDLPDYSYFNHSAHVTKGVGCASCHGRIDKMEVVHQDAPLSMGWCLECHRNPEPHLRPPDKVTQMDWSPNDDPHGNVDTTDIAAVSPPQDCQSCHR